MKYFRCLHTKIDPTRLLQEIDANQEAWQLNTSRQDGIKAQSETNTIFLRSPVRRPDLHVNENQESEFTSVSKRFPQALQFLIAFAQTVGAELSRATIVRLKPRSQVYSHIDMGSYYLIRNRYHFVLRSPNGSVLRSGNEQVLMQTGELWWFDNKQHHESFNGSDDWRIHYIFDLLPPAHRHLAVNALPPVDWKAAGSAPLEREQMVHIG